MTEFKIIYSSGTLNRNTKQFRKNQVQEIPQVIIKGEEDTYYTLVMVDPQANPQAFKNTHPTQTGFYSFLHWLIVNIPSTFDPSLFMELQTYIPPTPPSKRNRPNLQDTHYYYFQLYKQPRQLMLNTDKYFERPNSHMFNMSQFTQENNLQLVGEVKMAVTS